MNSRGDGLGISATTLVHAAGHDTASLWATAVQGQTGLQPNALEWCDLPCWIGVVPELEKVHLPKRLAAWDCRNHRLAWRALEAPDFQHRVADAAARYGGHRIGVLLGTSTAGVRDSELAYLQRLNSGLWPKHYDYRRSHAVDAVCRFTAEVLSLQGPMVGVATACSSSAKVFLMAQRWIAAGIIDAAVVGGVDSLCLSTLYGFNALQLLSKDLCRPFDSARNGISIGEAAGFMLLEKRPAPIRFVGGAESSDAWHMSAPHPQGIGAIDAMQGALAAAQLDRTDIGYINAHGTATPANDQAEAAALCAVFGPQGVPVSSTKGATGHALGAAGIVEAVLVTQVLAHQTLLPVANLSSPDEALMLNLVSQAKLSKLRYAMSNNFGFGGSNCSLIFACDN